MTKETGYSAFPNTHVMPFQQGMTLRDYFAAKAMQGLLASGTYEGAIDTYAELAQPAYKVADAMLKAREQ